MSGHKRATITITQEEYHRLYEAEKRNYYEALAISNESYEHSLESTMAYVQRSVDKLTSRKVDYESVLSSFQKDLREVERSVNQSIVDQHLDLYNKVMDYSENIWQDTGLLIKDHIETVKEMMDEQNEQYDSQMQNVSNRLLAIESKEDRLIASLNEWMKDIQLLTNYIYSEYPPELVEEFQVAQVLRQARLAERNFEDGFYEAAITIFQQVFFQLSNLRTEIETQLNQRSLLIHSMTDQLSLLMQRCVDLQKIHPIDLSGEELDEWIDVDYWTGQALRQLFEEVKALRTELHRAGLLRPVNQLQQLSDEKLPEFTDRLGWIVNEARRNALNSQLRFNIAQLVLLAVMSQGFKPQQGAYDEDDYRQGYIAKAASADGSEIIIKVDPGENFENDLHLMANYRGLLNEAEVKHRSLEVFQSLQAFGLNVGQVEQVANAQHRPNSRKHPTTVQKQQSARN